MPRPSPATLPQSEPEAINIAYTSVGLAPHVDLMYLESPPGLQFLHCMRFDEDVKGGESTLVDVLHVAEVRCRASPAVALHTLCVLRPVGCRCAEPQELRRTKPESFRTLCELPNTFQKVHYARASPVDIVYQRHHIVVNHVGEVRPLSLTHTRNKLQPNGDRRCFTCGVQVVAVNWSPPFEGPLCLPDRDVERFYDAYQDFEAQLQRTIAEQCVAGMPWRWCGPAAVLTCVSASSCVVARGVVIRLRPGDMLSFNNRRTLHGRTVFERCVRVEGAPTGGWQPA